jgi:ABC-type uncharacterized transport system auxiliary subunit
MTSPPPEDHFYRVEPEFQGIPDEKPQLEGTLVIDAVSADPLRSGRAVLFRQQHKPLQLQRYHYAFWVEQPPRMIQQVLRQYIQTSGIATSVEDDKSSLRNPDYEISSKLLRFEQVVAKQHASVDLEMEVVFRAPGSDTSWRRVYQQQLKADGDDMHAMASAMQKALGQVFSRILEDLKQFESHS